MITYFTRNQIDILKYDDCILRATCSLSYGYSWYLDAVCVDWGALVLNDYTAVMPLPKRKKYGIHYIYLASWVQQLGVFSIKAVDAALVNAFIGQIPKKFKLIDVVLNSGNSIENSHNIKKDNFILSLENKTYPTLQKEYSKGRKSSIKQAVKLGLIIERSTSADVLIDLFKQHSGSSLRKTDQTYVHLQNLVKKAMSRNRMLIFEVFDASHNLLGGAIFIKDKYRITNLFSALNKEGRNKQAMSFLIDYVIKKHANKPLVLDFEGSMVPEIASFYKSFGANKEIYFHYKKWQWF